MSLKTCFKWNILCFLFNLFYIFCVISLECTSTEPLKWCSPPTWVLSPDKCLYQDQDQYQWDLQVNKTACTPDSPTDPVVTLASPLCFKYWLMMINVWEVTVSWQLMLKQCESWTDYSPHLTFTPKSVRKLTHCCCCSVSNQNFLSVILSACCSCFWYVLVY